MGENITLDVKNEIAEVGRANDILRELWIERGLPEEHEPVVSMCLEEVLSNVIRHGCAPGEDCAIQVGYRFLDAGIEVEVSDGAKAFDPLSLPPPDLTVPIAERKVGGLGVFLVRRMMDEVHYERRDGRNYFVFRKFWRAAAG